jgi:flagellar export protein FliJ
MNFVFRLETPLRLARHHEEQSRRALGEAFSALERERERLRTLENDLSEEVGAQKRPRQGEIWIQGQSLFLEWAQGQHTAIARSREACREAGKIVELARADLVEKRRAVQVLERLRERRLAQWKLELSRKELAESSDVAGRRWMAQHRLAAKS